MLRTVHLIRLCPFLMAILWRSNFYAHSTWGYPPPFLFNEPLESDWIRHWKLNLKIQASQGSQHLPILPNKILFWLNTPQCSSLFRSNFNLGDKWTIWTDRIFPLINCVGCCRSNGRVTTILQNKVFLWKDKKCPKMALCLHKTFLTHLVRKLCYWKADQDIDMKITANGHKYLYTLILKNRFPNIQAIFESLKIQRPCVQISMILKKS